MNKHGVKIVILFILALTIIAAGIYMYRKISYSKQIDMVNIYDYLLVDAYSITNIKNTRGLNQVLKYDESLADLTALIGKKKVFPLIIVSDRDNSKAIMIKSELVSPDIVLSEIEDNLETSYPPKIRKYKNAIIYIYCCANNRFISVANHKGIICISENYKLLENIIDTDPEHNFLSYEKDQETTRKILDSQSVTYFIDQSSCRIRTDIETRNDSVILQGIIQNRVVYETTSDSILNIYRDMIYRIPLACNSCIDSIYLKTNESEIFVKVNLNKND